ncbi:hypothetical protein V8E54_009988 [Elaphomyces granulatus]
MASITQFISVRASSTFTNRSLPQVPQSDNIVLAPVTIHPDTAILQPDEFTIKGQQYIRCRQLSGQAPKSTKKRISVVWKYGEDIQSKRDAKKFCYEETRNFRS